MNNANNSTPPIESLFESQKYVSHTPPLPELTTDSTRTNMFEYDGQSSYQSIPERGETIWRMTEVEGLKNLSAFLGYVASLSSDHSLVRHNKSPRLDRVSAVCTSILENITFIGQKEADVAIDGIARLWAHHLTADKSHQILLLSNPSTDTGKDRVIKKSDTFISTKILAALSSVVPDVQVESRVVRTPEKLQARPEQTLSVLADDWVITGTQMSDWCKTIFKNKRLQPYLKQTQIHLMAAPKKLLENGFYVPEFPGTIEVKAYYEAHRAETSEKGAPCHATGTHSSVGFGFATDIEIGLRAIRKAAGSKLPRPALVSVYRPYWPKGSAQRSK